MIVLHDEHDAHLTKIREVVASIDAQLMRTSVMESRDVLRESWRSLVNLLELGEMPALRECSFCHHLGSKNAIRCGFCWNRFAQQPPFIADASETSHASLTR